MDNYNLCRYNRLKQFYRFYLGIQQLICYPWLNMLWLIFGGTSALFVRAVRRLVKMFEIYPTFAPIYQGCMKFVIIFFLILCGIGVIQLIGHFTSIKDEADMKLVFGNKTDTKVEYPILIYKKKIKKKSVTIREFYTSIPMAIWQEKKEAISDRLNIRIIGDLEYGGKHNNKGNHIIIKSAKGRKGKNRGVLYDDTF